MSMDVLASLTAGVRNPARKADGSEMKMRGTPDGALFTADWLLGLALEGRIFAANVGSATAPATFKTGYTDTQPELNIDVRDKWAVLLLQLNVYLETSAGTINEIVAGVSQAARGAGTSTAVTPRPYRSDMPAGGPASVVTSLYSGAGAASVNLVELWRSGYAFADTTVGPVKQFIWTPPVPAVICGPHSFSVWVGGTTTAAAGFIEAIYAELPPGAF